MTEKKNSLPQTAEGIKFLQNYQAAVRAVHQEVIGLDEVIENIFIAMLAAGHVILEGEPGVGKTLVARSIAKTINISNSYIQFTPETMPSDLFYSMDLFDRRAGGSLKNLSFSKGPIFSNFIIGDEINRAIPRIHGAILAPLEEGILALEGEVHDLGPLYFWIATQNPVESSETTSLLPEALQERFMIMIRVPYPSEELLREITINADRAGDIKPVFELEDIVVMRDMIFSYYVDGMLSDSPIVSYIQRLIGAIHDHPVVSLGPGIRAAQDLIRVAAVHAFLRKKRSITFDDVKAMAEPTLRFKFKIDPRLARKYHRPIAGNDDVVREILSTVSVVEAVM